MNYEYDSTSNIRIGCAIEVHKLLGPGLLESSYEACLVYELIQKKLKVERQKALPIVYKNIKLDTGYRLDLVVEDKIIVELKSVDALLPIHEAQLLSYLKLSNIKTGLLINFNVKLLKNGIKRLSIFNSTKITTIEPTESTEKKDGKRIEGITTTELTENTEKKDGRGLERF